MFVLLLLFYVATPALVLQHLLLYILHKSPDGSHVERVLRSVLNTSCIKGGAYKHLFARLLLSLLGCGKRDCVTNLGS